MYFSVIIPVAPGRNAEILECLKKLDYPKEKYETLVEWGTNASENRNSGISKARFDNLVFLDDDARIDDDLLKNIKIFFEQNPDFDVVGGVQLTPETDSRFSKISGIALSSFWGAYKMKNRYAAKKIKLNASEKDLTSAICAIKRRVFDKVGNFNPNHFPGEDPEFFMRVKKNNFKMANDPDIKIYHKRRPDYLSFFQQIYSYGFVRPKISKFSFSPVFIMPSLFLTYLILSPFLILSNRLFFIPLVLYIMLALIFSFYESVKNKDFLVLIVLPFLYLTIHIAYGIGFIVGLIKKN